MNFKIESTSLESIESGALIVLHTRQGMTGTSPDPLLQKHIDFYKKSVESKETHAEWFCTIESDSSAKTPHMLLHSVMFDPFAPGMEAFKTVAAACTDICRRYSITKVAIAMQGDIGLNVLPHVFEGIFLGDFTDHRFKSSPPDRPDLEVVFLVDEDKKEKAEGLLSRQKPVITAQNRARELVNAPYNKLHPLDLAEHALGIANRFPTVTCSVLREEELEKQGYGLITAVGGGAKEESCLIELQYTPRESVVAPPAIIVGKGVCFDTGGYSIKSREKMPTMNADMAGGAAALEAFAALVELDCARPLTLLLPAVVNSIDAHAFFPGAIITSKSGKTVFIENTDAEGRLVLADALGRAAEILREQKVSQNFDAPITVDPVVTQPVGTPSPGTSTLSDSEKGSQAKGSAFSGQQPSNRGGALTGGTSQPTLITIATLTGAAGTALGERIGAIFTHDQELRNRFIDTGMRTGDHVWPLPLCAEYQPTLFHSLADLSNLSSMGQTGGAIHAANFIQHFVPPGVRWAHLDMSRPARSVGRNRYFRPGATGYGVRLLVEALSKA